MSFTLINCSGTSGAFLINATVKNPILFPCLSVVSREHMKGWVPVCQHGEMAFDDIDLLTMLQLVARVVADSLGNFLQGLPTSETPTPPAE